MRLEKGAIYVFDYSTYWIPIVQLVQSMREGTSFSSVLATAYQSVGQSDYNLLPDIPLLPFQYLPMGSRVAYILSIFWVYGGLVYLGVSRVSAGLGAEGEPSHLGRFVPGVVVLTTALFWQPLLSGSLDCLGVGMCLIALWAYASRPFSLRAWGWFLLAGALLGFVPVLRRWYAFWVVGFVCVSTVESAYITYQQWKKKKDYCLPFFLLFLLGLGCAMVLLLFPDFVERAIKINQNNPYSGYRMTSSALEEAGVSFLHFGLLPAVLFGWSVFLGFRIAALRRLLVCGTVASLLSYVLLLRMQSPGPQHYYLLLIGYLAAVAPVATACCRGMFTPWVRRGLLGCLGIAALACIADPLIWGSVPRPLAWRVVFGEAALKPCQRSDLDEIQRLTGTLDQIEATHQGIYIYVLSSSALFCDDTLTHATLPTPGLRFAAAGRVIPTFHVDSRDGFPTNLLAAHVVVVADPVQLHLLPENQRVVAVPARQLLEHRGLGSAFERIAGPFRLDRGVSAYIYGRTRQTTRAEAEDLSRELNLPLPPLR